MMALKLFMNLAATDIAVKSSDSRGNKKSLCHTFVHASSVEYRGVMFPALSRCRDKTTSQFDRSPLPKKN